MVWDYVYNGIGCNYPLLLFQDITTSPQSHDLLSDVCFVIFVEGVGISPFFYPASEHGRPSGDIIALILGRMMQSIAIGSCLLLIACAGIYIFENIPTPLAFRDWSGRIIVDHMVADYRSHTDHPRHTLLNEIHKSHFITRIQSKTRSLRIWGQTNCAMTLFE